MIFETAAKWKRIVAVGLNRCYMKEILIGLSIFAIYHLALLAHEAWVLASEHANKQGPATNLPQLATTVPGKYPNKTVLKKNLALRLRRASALHELAAGRGGGSNSFEVGRALTLLRKAIVAETVHGSPNAAKKNVTSFRLASSSRQQRDADWIVATAAAQRGRQIA